MLTPFFPWILPPRPRALLTASAGMASVHGNTPHVSGSPPGRQHSACACLFPAWSAGREQEHGYKLCRMGRWVLMAPPPHSFRLSVTHGHTRVRTHTVALDTETGETPDAACSLPKILQLHLLKKCKTGRPCISPRQVANLGFPAPGNAGAREAAPCARLPTHARLCRLTPTLCEAGWAPRVCVVGVLSAPHRSRVKSQCCLRSSSSLPGRPREAPLSTPRAARAGSQEGRPSASGRRRRGNLWDSRLASPKLPSSMLLGGDRAKPGQSVHARLHTPAGHVDAGPGASRRVDQGARGRTKAAFGFSVKAGTGRRVPPARSAAPLEEPVWPSRYLLLSSSPRGPLGPPGPHLPALSASPGLAESARCLEGRRGLAGFCRPRPHCPQRALI